MIKYIALLVMCSLPVLSLQAQKLMGLVVEQNAEGVDQPLAGANVVWLGTTVGAATGENGVFLIERVPGVDKLVVSFVGYKTDTITVTNQTSIKVTLVSDEFLEGVTVQGWKPSSGIDHSRGINTQIMTEKELFKAACCNLSESFETNPSVDVAFTDAITGTRQIQMLGLAGPNTMIAVENMPGVRGLAASQGIQFIPGTWINSIQVTKGIGSVVNGYESIAGQINVELKKPQESEKLYVNGYLNQSARSELNLNYTLVTGDHWATTFLLHGSTRPIEMDENDDSFLDFPTGSQYNFINRWVYNNGKGLLGQFGVKWLSDTKQGGQVDFDPEQDKFGTTRYGFEINTKRYEAWGKLGYQFANKPYKSIGLQVSAIKHEHDSYFGFNEHVGDESTFYANLIYQSIISNTFHKFKAGISYQYDAVDERLTNSIDGFEYNGDAVTSRAFDRSESIPGAFFEYTYDNTTNFSLIAGIRVDYHNLFGTLTTPRLHMKFDASPTTSFRASVGKGIRLANVLTENTGVLASARRLIFSGAQTDVAYGFKPDVAWNTGLNATQEFTLNYRTGVITVDYFYTTFDRQAILDVDNSAREARFMSLNGKSYSNSLQFQIDYELARRFDLRMAYRWLDVRTTYTEGLLMRPLIAQHRSFINLAYETKSKWKFDYTVTWYGKQRIPDTSLNDEQYQLGSYAPDYVLMNAQITKDFNDKWSAYLGVENIGNFQIDNPVVASDAVFENGNLNSNFDSSMAWGPIFGRMVYVGFRYRIK